MSIKEAQARKLEVFKARPSSAKGAGQTHIRLDSGTRCEVTQDDWSLVCDQSKMSGGAEAGPDPGFFGRAALGACLAQGYAIQLTLRDLSFETILVDVQSEIDGRGAMGLDDAIPPGYQSLRYFVEIVSSEDSAEILEVVEFTERHSPWLYNLTTAIPAEREIVIKPG